MSRATDRIAFFWFGKGDATFLTAGEDLAEEDTPLLEAGVFKLAAEEQQTMLCPFGCGDIEPIHVLPRYDGKGTGHFVICSRGHGERELLPKEYQLYSFNATALLSFNKRLDSIASKSRVRKKVHPQDTNWIRIEREAVMDFANDPKRNKSGKMPYELCDRVWNLNRTEFEAAASLPIGQRGYKCAASLRAYFYRQHTKRQVQKATIQTN